MTSVTQYSNIKKFILIYVLCQSPRCCQGQEVCDIFTSDYKVLHNTKTYIDKTDFIRHVLVEETSLNILITRPRRSGKSLNLDTLKEYLEIKFNEKTGEIFHKNKSNDILNKLFQGKRIENFQYEEDFRGQFPVIILDFKCAREENAAQIEAGLKSAITKEFCRFKSLLLNHKSLDETDKEVIRDYAKGNFGDQLRDSVRRLTEFLYNVFEKEVYVFVDEYDSPIIDAYCNGPCRNNQKSEACANQRALTMSLVKLTLLNTLKSNKKLKRGIIMGVAYFTEGEILSSLNNVNKHTVLHLGSPFVNDFGFTANEVNTLLNRFNIKGSSEKDMKYWYNGYKYFNEFESLYNPVSVIQFVKTKRLNSYWVDTGGSNLLQTIFAAHVKELWPTLMNLIKWKHLTKKLPISINIKDLMSLDNSDIFYSAAIHFGYLNAELTDMVNYDITENTYELYVPNYEIIKCMYVMLLDWLKTRDKSIPERMTEIGELFIEALITTDVHEKLKEKLSSFFEIFLNVVKPEVKPVDQDDYLHFHELSFEDMIMICLYATKLKDHMIIKKEWVVSGKKRVDIGIVPRESICNTPFNKVYGNFASIIELKTTREPKKVKNLSKMARKEIEDNKYINIIYDKKYVHPEIKYVIYLDIVFNAFIENNVARQNVAIGLKNVTVVDKSETAAEVNYQISLNEE